MIDFKMPSHKPIFNLRAPVIGQQSLYYKIKVGGIIQSLISALPDTRIPGGGIMAGQVNTNFSPAFLRPSASDRAAMLTNNPRHNR